MEEIIGQHIILDLYDCRNADKTEKDLDCIFHNALSESNFTVINKFFHQFEPHGVSGVFVLAESHLAFHVWTELNFISLDVYWCGKKCDEQKLINTIVDYFEPKKVNFQFLNRGSL
jgi:S-adenosylmethionine decarboxylase proenzyme